MSESEDKTTRILEAHQELVERMERSASRIRALSVVTIAVAFVLSASYVSQLLLPVTGTRSVTVDLTDPAIQASELVVLALALVWLYVGVRDLRFSSRVRSQIRRARSKEGEIRQRISANAED